MIKLKANEGDRILIIEMSGTINEADIDRAVETLGEQYPDVGVHVRGGARGGFSVLLDWRDLEGWEKGAKTLGTMTSKMIGDSVRKVAILAGPRFADEQPRLADVAPRATVRLFAPERREDALAWLRG